MDGRKQALRGKSAAGRNVEAAHDAGDLGPWSKHLPIECTDSTIEIDSINDLEMHDPGQSLARDVV